MACAGGVLMGGRGCRQLPMFGAYSERALRSATVLKRRVCLRVYAARLTPGNKEEEL